ncbi:Uncharacterised protein [Vibrio cholerae]|nr:Uncharacterised protein [Vibrio cholerae]
MTTGKSSSFAQLSWVKNAISCSALKVLSQYRSIPISPTAIKVWRENHS